MGDASVREREYELALSLMNEESNRAWTRFSILVGAQVVVLAAILGNLDRLEGTTWFRWALAAMLCYALLVVVIVAFGILTTATSQRIVLEIEAGSNGAHRLLTMAKGRLSTSLWVVNQGSAFLLAAGAACLWALLSANARP